MKKVHLVFKTHLDLGFTDLAARVVQGYLIEYFPRALQTAARLRQRGGSERLVWTTGSWLIWEALRVGSPQLQARVRQGIAQGDLVWHGLPYTLHTELAEASLLAYGLSYAQRLDQQFDRQTIAAKMTDVPGHTRGLVPILAAGGIEFLHLGVNEASSPPQVPQLFRWQSPEGSQLVVGYDFAGYGGVLAPEGLDEALMFAHTSDNLGPQGEEEVLEAFETARRLFPGALVEASSLDRFARALRPLVKGLPVVSGEIGDTWIHGVGSDPARVAQFRQLSRLRQAWLQRGVPAETLEDFSHHLLLVAEHTWGLDVKTFLNDWENYAPEEFAAVRHQPNFQLMEESWREQRGYLQSALEGLPAELAAEAQQQLAALQPQPLVIRSRTVQTSLQLGDWQIELDAQDGTVLGLRYRGGRRWGPLARLRYQQFSQADYDRWWQQYNRGAHNPAVEWWGRPDFTKPGMEKAGQASGMYAPSLQGVEVEGNRAVLYLNGASRGGPGQYRITLEGEEAVLRLTLDWFHKPAHRLPEAIWFSFQPNLEQPQSWQLDKLGQWILPLEVVPGGNRKLHAVQSGVRTQGLMVRSLDAPLVAPGVPDPLSYEPQQQPDLAGGMHFNLYNNLWGTNFAMWYQDDARFRFEVEVAHQG